MLRIKEKPECLPIEKVIFKMLAHLYNGYNHYKSYDLCCPANIEKRRPDYPLSETTKKKKKIPQTNYIKQQCPNHGTPGNRWQLSLRDGKQMRGARTLPPDSHPERVSSLWHREGKLNENPVTLLNQGHRAEIGGARAHRTEVHKERTLEICSECPQILSRMSPR